MPVRSCTEDGKPGYKYGDAGKCFVYTPGDEASRKRALAKAREQGVAIAMSRARERGRPGKPTERDFE